MRRILFTGIFFIALLISGCKTMALDQSVLFYPNQLSQYNAIPFLEEINVADTLKNVLNGIELKKKDRKKVLLFFHGNSGSVWDRDFIETVKIADTLGYNLIAIDYTGYGKSQGKPSIALLYINAAAIYDYALKTYVADSIIIWGESLGSIPACRLASEKKGHKVIIESGLTTSEEIVPNVIKNNTSAFQRLFVRFKTTPDLIFNVQADIKKSTQPFLFVYGDKDNTILLEQAKRNYEFAVNQAKQLYIVEGAGHNETHRDLSVFLKTFKTFIEK